MYEFSPLTTEEHESESVNAVVAAVEEQGKIPLDTAKLVVSYLGSERLAGGYTFTYETQHVKRVEKFKLFANQTVEGTSSSFTNFYFEGEKRAVSKFSGVWSIFGSTGLVCLSVNVIEIGASPGIHVKEDKKVIYYEISRLNNARCVHLNAQNDEVLIVVT